MNLLENVELNFDYKIKEYKNDDIVFFEGETLNVVGIVLDGSVVIKSSTLDGFEYDITKITKGNIFADALVSKKDPILPGTICAKGNTRIIFIKNTEFKKLLFENKTFLNNYLIMTSERNIKQQYKIKLLSQPSIREKLLFYIKDEMKKQKSKKIRLSMNKEELANMMSLNRPSLSRELKRMKDDKLIDYDKWTVTYLK